MIVANGKKSDLRTAKRISYKPFELETPKEWNDCSQW